MGHSSLAPKMVGNLGMLLREFSGRKAQPTAILQGVIHFTSLLIVVRHLCNTF
jgi:hypothetical protein